MNKKLIIWIFAFVLMCSFAFADDYTLQDSYTSGGAADGITYSGTVNALSTSFNVTVSDYLMTKLSVQFANWSLSQPSNVSIRVYNLTNGTALPDAYSYEVISDDNITFSGAGGTYSYYNFTFIKNGGIQLEKAKFYGISIVIQPNRTNGELRVYEGSSTGYDEFYTTAGIPKTDSGWQDWAGHTGKRFNFRAFNCSTCMAGASYQKYINFSGTYAPLNGYLSNSNTINFNATFNISNIINSANCSLYINGTLNVSINISSGTNVLPNFTKTLSDGNYSSVYINCYLLNSTNSINSTNSSVFIDTINPTITTNFQNLSYFFNKNITGIFNTSDNNGIHTFNLTINGVTIFNRTGINNVTYNYTLNIAQASPVVEGINTLNLYIADGHTATALIDNSAWDYDKGIIFHNSLAYNFKRPYKEGYIKIYQKDPSLFDSWDTKALTDRYSFSFSPSKLSDKYTFVVEASDKLYIVNQPNSIYKKWIIFNEHWLDLYPYEVADIRRIKDNMLELDIINIDSKSEKLEFSSVGDLNIVRQYYVFYVDNATTTYSNPVAQTEFQTMILNITTYGLNSTNATLTWNRTIMNVTKTAYANSDLYTSQFATTAFNANVNVSFEWNFTLYGSLLVNTTGYLNYSQTVLDIGLDNCSGLNTRGVDFLVKNSTNDQLINSTADGYLGIYYSDINIAKYFALQWSENDTRQSICITPSNAIFNITGQMEFFIGNVVKTYYFTNATINNNTQSINIYTGTGSTLVSFTITDENDNPVEDAYITIMYYDFGTNTYQTSEIIKTDTQGKAIGNIVLNTVWYKFIITYNNVVYLETNPTKLITNTYSFQINLGSDYFENYDVIDNIACNVIFSNATRCFSYTFTNPSGSSIVGCMDLKRVIISGKTSINQSCTTAASGTINLCVGEANRTSTYIATGTITTGGNTFVCDDETYSYTQTFKSFGKDGIFMTFLLTLTLIGIGIWSPIVAILLMIVAIVFSVIMQIFFLGWGALIALIIVGIITMIRLNK